MRFKFATIILLFILFAPVVPAQEFYAPLHLAKIELTFAEEDWQYPLHYYQSLKTEQRHVGKAVIDGQAFDSVGVRFKGFSSYSRNNQKNPLNIKLDHLRKNANHQGFETLKLSNGNLDPSWLREILAYRIARKYMVAPQSNYARVFVNGTYHGLFGNTESVDGKFAKRYLPAGKNNVIVKGNSPLGPFAGKRSSLEYLGADTTAYYSSYEMKSKHGWQQLAGLINILNNQPDQIETVLDMDRAIWMLAFNNVLVNLDSYSDFQQNFYLIQDDHGRFHFVLWDVNLAFDGLGKPQGVRMQFDYDPLAKQKDPRFPLINLVLNHPTYRKVYFAHCRTILKENFLNDWYKQEAEKYRNLIREAVREDANSAFSFADFEKNFTQTVIREQPSPFPYPGLVELMDARRTFLQNHPAYRAAAPEITAIEAFISPKDSSGLTVRAVIKNHEKAYIFYRKKSSDIFQKLPLYDDGKHVDEKAGDGVYSALIPIGKKKVEYYIFAENREAAQFSPERAEHEFYRYEKEKELPF